MTTIALAKMVDCPLSEDQRRIMAGVLFEMLGGLTELDQKRWKGFWRELMAAGSGEIFSVQLAIVRNGTFHRRHMKLESTLFDAQEAYASFPQFRNWLKVGAGFCEWKERRGQLIAEPKSISYEECDQHEMEQFHTDAIAFLRTRHAQEHLYPLLSPVMAEDMIETLLGRFDA